MSGVGDTIADGLGNALLMAWEVWWALVLGFTISAIVQAWVPRERVARSLGREGPRAVGLATALGAASSSCSYAAVAIAKSLFQKGASAASSLAFQFASTNLVLELGIVIWILLGWQFALAELLGGLALVTLTAVLLRVFVSPRLEREARDAAEHADAGHQHAPAVTALPLRERLSSIDAWSDVAHNFRNDWRMVWREILAGFLLAGFVGLLGNGFFNGLFLTHAPALVRELENVLVGPLIAVLSFVCSVGNVPLAAVLWSGGIGFGGVIAFVFADLIVLPIVLIYRRYYGGRFALRIVALMLVTIVLAALAVSGLFHLAGLVPATRPARAGVFGHLALDYKVPLNALATIVFAVLVGLTLRRGAVDPVCGMRVERSRALTLEHGGRTLHFCGEHCREQFAREHSRAVPPAPAPRAHVPARGGG